MDDLLFHAVRSPNLNCFQALLVTQQISYPTLRPRPRPLGISAPKRRLSNISRSNDNSFSVNSKFVSAIELSDGSILFRFGNWSKTERSVTLEESAKDDAELSDVTPKQEMLEKESSHVLKKQVKFHSKRRQKNQPVKDISVHRQDTHSDLTETLNNSERLSEDAVFVLGSQTNVHPEEASNEKANGECLTTVSACDDVKQEKDNNALEGNSERKGETRVNTSSVDSKLELVSDVQKESSKDSQSIEFTQASTVANEHNVDIISNHETGEDGVGGRAIEEMLELISLEADSMLDDKTTPSTVDEFVETNRTGSSKMLDGFVCSSIEKEETTMPDVPSSKTADVSVSFAKEFQSVGTTLKRDGISTRFFLSFGTASLAHPFKALTVRGDAYFVASQNWLGIADGFGQWSFEGNEAGLYPQELMQNFQKIVLESEIFFSVIDPVEILNRSVAASKSPGSSTVLVAYFDGQALHVANIGDTGFIIMRNGCVFKRSSPMVHEFHFPIHIESGGAPSELVEVYKVDLDEGDVIVTATDGLFDNLYEQEIASITSKSLHDGFKPQEIAESLAARAQEVGNSESARSPFADAAQAAGYVGYRGGKVDDATVIVSLVEKTCSSPS